MSDDLSALVDALLSARKYRDLGLPRETVQDLIARELPHYRHARDALDAARRKLHNLVAPYLGDPDYSAAALNLEQAFASGRADPVTGACRQILAHHASTRERLEILDEFYPRLWQATGAPPASLLDLASGLNPFTWRWMGLPPGARYRAYEIHAPRAALISHYFNLEQADGAAVLQDVLVMPPQECAGAALLFKEAHRIEQRRRGATRELLDALRVDWVLLSLPPSNLTGQRDLVDRQRALVQDITQGADWPVHEVDFANELVFCIRRGNGPASA